MISDKKQIFSVVATALALGGVGFFSFVLILQPIFSGQIILPQSLTLGSLHLQYYGLLIGLAALSGYWLLMKLRHKYRIEKSDADNLLFLVLVCGFVGARLYHVFSEAPFYFEHPRQIIAVWNGGLSIFGADLGGFIGLVAYRKYFSKYSMMQLLDWITPGVVLGQIIGRFGNFVNYELFGNPTTLPWKMFVPEQFRLAPFENAQFFHPLFLYEASGSIVILMLLLRLKLRPGQLFLLWLFLYNVMRFFLEFLRVGSITYANIRINAVVAMVLAIFAAVLWIHRNRKSQT